MSSTDSYESIAKEATASGFAARSRYFIIGAGTVVDVGGRHLKPVKFGSVTQDRKKIQQDFWSVGQDLKTILRKHRKLLAK